MGISDLFGLLSWNVRDNRFFKSYFTSQFVGEKAPIWINTSEYWHHYKTVPELAAVINRRAKMVASANPIVVDKYGNKIEPNGHWIFDLIDKPNAVQSWGKMMEFIEINKCVTGNAIIYSPKLSFNARKVMTPIAWNNVKIVTTGKSLHSLDRESVIQAFKIPMKGTVDQYETIDIKDIIYLFEVDGVNLFDVETKIAQLKYPISNLTAQYEKRNSLLQSMFSPGILGMDVSDGTGYVPLNSKDREQVTQDFMNRNSGKPVITDKKVTWQPMSFPVKDLMLFEEMNADKIAIIDAFGLNQHMFGSDSTAKGSTFSNVEMGEKQAYNSTIIPETELTYDDITQQINLDKDGMFLKPDFSHISALKQDETAAADALLKRATALEKITAQVQLSDEERRALLLI